MSAIWRLLRASPSALASLVLLAAFACGNPANAAIAGEADDSAKGPPERYIIGLDISKSNPLVDSESYAASAADLVASAVEDLPMASVVMIRTFGSYEGQLNNLRIDRQISTARDEKPAAVADLVRQVIGGVPQMVRNGTLEVQDRTNIVPFLENMSAFVDCSKMDTTVVLVSDGIEDSEYAKLTRADDSLPRPSSSLYSGCSELMIVGLGQGAKSPSLTARLQSEWSAWAKSAGFKDFEGFNDW